MIRFSDIPKLIKDLNTPWLKIRDTNEQLIFEIGGSALVDVTIKKLQEVEKILKSYGRIYIHAATANIIKGKWKGAYVWEVDFSDEISPAMAKQPLVSHQTAALANTDELIALQKKIEKMEYDKKQEKWEREHDQKIKDLEEKFEKKSKSFMDYIPVLLPAASELFGIDKAKVEKIMGMFNGVAANSNASLAGPPETTEKTLTMQMTPEEEQKKLGEINTQIEPIYNKIGANKMYPLMTQLNQLVHKCECDKIIKLMAALNNNPALVDTALNFIK